MKMKSKEQEEGDRDEGWRGNEGVQRNRRENIIREVEKRRREDTERGAAHRHKSKDKVWERRRRTERSQVKWGEEEKKKSRGERQ